MEEENQKAQRAEKRKRTAEDGEGGGGRKRKSGGRRKKQDTQSEESGEEEEEAEMSGDGRERRERSRSKSKKIKVSFRVLQRKHSDGMQKPRKKRVIEDPDGDDVPAAAPAKKKSSRFMYVASTGTADFSGFRSPNSQIPTTREETMRTLPVTSLKLKLSLRLLHLLRQRVWTRTRWQRGIDYIILVHFTLHHLQALLVFIFLRSLLPSHYPPLLARCSFNTRCDSCRSIPLSLP